MPFLLVKGTFQVKGFFHNGNSIRFVANNALRWKKISGRVNLQNNMAQLRIQAIDTLETHYRGHSQPKSYVSDTTDFLLENLGVKNIEWDTNHSEIINADDNVPGYILVREAEQFGRPIAFVFTGTSKEKDGAEIFLDTKFLKQSVNYKLIKKGMAYLTFYGSLFDDLRKTLVNTYEIAKENKNGLFAVDNTETGFAVSNINSVVQENVILPKLFRRICTFFHQDTDIRNFKDYLEESPEKVLLIKDNELTTFDKLIEIKGSTLRLTTPIQNILFQPIQTARHLNFQVVNVYEGHNLPEKDDLWTQRLLKLPYVWQKTKGKDIKIAVLDTGIDEHHTALKHGILKTKDFTGEGIDDTIGHGTHCAGIIIAKIRNFGIIGVAPDTKLLIGKVLGANGGKDKNIVDGITWAVSEGADIVSMSLGCDQSSPDLFEAVHSAISKGIIVVCAAGNSGSLLTNSIGYPGKYGAVITVASHDHNGNRSGFSSKGGEIDFMGPGTAILSTYKKNSYAVLNGTSMAAPFVAGLAALILSKHRKSTINQTPIFNNEDMRNHLMRLAAHPGYFDSDRGYGPLLPIELLYDNDSQSTLKPKKNIV